MTLSNLSIGSTGVVKSLDADTILRRRLLDIGLTPGTTVTALFQSPFHDPVAYEVRGAIIALRSEDAALVKITEPGRKI